MSTRHGAPQIELRAVAAVRVWDLGDATGGRGPFWGCHPQTVPRLGRQIDLPVCGCIRGHSCSSRRPCTPGGPIQAQQRVAHDLPALVDYVYYYLALLHLHDNSQLPS